jgi:hypothetical protein
MNKTYKFRRWLGKTMNEQKHHLLLPVNNASRRMAVVSPTTCVPSLCISKPLDGLLLHKRPHLCAVYPYQLPFDSLM